MNWESCGGRRVGGVREVWGRVYISHLDFVRDSMDSVNCFTHGHLRGGTIPSENVEDTVEILQCQLPLIRICINEGFAFIGRQRAVVSVCRMRCRLFTEGVEEIAVFEGDIRLEELGVLVFFGYSSYSVYGYLNVVLEEPI
jgi:hypothetical protein